MLKILVCLLGALNLTTVFGAEVIYDAGGSVPSAQYLAQLFAIDQENPNGTPPGLHYVSFPIVSRSMTSGKLTVQQHLAQPAWLVQPVFLIGDDPESRLWLTSHLEQLHKQQAMGLVVNVSSYEAFRDLQNIALGLQMAPASGDGLAQSMGVKLYPVLLEPSGEISQ